MDKNEPVNTPPEEEIEQPAPASEPTPESSDADQTPPVEAGSKVVALEEAGKEMTVDDEVDEEAAVDERPRRPEKKVSWRAARREAKVLSRYADIRRQQYEVFTRLLDTLTRVDDLPETHLQQVRDAIFHTDHPFLLTLVGPFSSGKSTVINALLGEVVLEVGPIPTTDHIAILRHGPDVQRSRSGEVSSIMHPSELLERISLVDTPGLESVFERHDKLTMSFLHRADIIILVMFATQVLTASDLSFIQSLKEYGKRLIIMVNQVDVLEPSEREEVRTFVEEQASRHLGLQPIIWLVSAKQALAASSQKPFNEELWEESGFAEVEDYLYDTLDDVERVRQKLETPLQIARNATQAAIKHVSASQSALDEHRKTVENIEAQIAAAERDRRRLLDKALDNIDTEWSAATARGTEAIREMFQVSRAAGQSLSGCLEIVGLRSLIRRFRKKTDAQEAFRRHRVRESLERVPAIADKLGPSLEGRDQEDIDYLVDYTREQIRQLPDTLRNKVIGKVQTPLSYERKALRGVRGDLEDILGEAGHFEASRIDRALRGTIITMGLWLFMIIVLGVLTAAGTALIEGGDIIQVVIILVLALVGLAILPARGWLLEQAYANRLKDLKARYTETLSRAAKEQISYGTQLRYDVTAPFTRLIKTQTEQVDELKRELQSHEQDIIGLQHSMSALLKG